MDFDAIFNMLKIRKQSHFPTSSTEAVDIIVNVIKIRVIRGLDTQKRRQILKSALS